MENVEFIFMKKKRRLQLIHKTFTNHYTHKSRNGESLAAKCLKTECLFISVIFKRMFQVKRQLVYSGVLPKGGLKDIKQAYNQNIMLLYKIQVCLWLDFTVTALAISYLFFRKHSSVLASLPSEKKKEHKTKRFIYQKYI